MPTMDRTTDEHRAMAPPPLRVSRLFHAPRATVFNAWGSADSLRRWFSPETYTTPDARVEMVVGGPFEVLMRSPSGGEHWTRGVFREVSPHARLVIEMRVDGAKGEPLFTAHTIVTFTDALAGTRMDVVQTYRFADPSIAAPMIAGAAEGWRTTLDKLEREVIRLQYGG